MLRKPHFADEGKRRRALVRKYERESAHCASNRFAEFHFNVQMEAK